MRIALGVTLAVLGLAGCAHRQPMTSRDTAGAPPAASNVERGELAGVRLQVEPAGRQVKREAAGAVLPVRLSLWNNSGRPLRFRFEDLALVGRGEPLAALLPVPAGNDALGDERGIGGAGSAVEPTFQHQGFHVAAPYARYYAGLPAYNGPFDIDERYEGNHFAAWAAPSSPEQLAQALPEGVIDDGGSISGIVYFARPPQYAGPLNLNAALVDARTGEHFGTVQLILQGQ